MRLLLVVAMSLGHLAASVAAEAQKPSSAHQGKESISEKLDKGKGVIKPPPGIDPDIAHQAPALPNATPVIPPPAPGAK
jgi:hypothetical protein